jgi:uncharacterized protein YjbJ (UPF0337 family)
MNKHQAKGATRNAAGKVQKAAGRAVGSKKLQAKGIGNQIAGKSQKKLGDAKQAVENARDRRR